jgi:quercetin dioxygenase-like cupin family protein
MAADPREDLMRQPIADEFVMVGRVPTTFKITTPATGGAYSVVEQVVEPLQLVWPHVHAGHDQLAIVLSGELGVRVGENEWVAGPGELAWRPRGLPHAVWNVGSTRAVFLEVTSPGSFENYFLSLSGLSPEAVVERAALQTEFGVAAVENWADDLAERYGVRL